MGSVPVTVLGVLVVVLGVYLLRRRPQTVPAPADRWLRGGH
jgi:hypothetical protein